MKLNALKELMPRLPRYIVQRALGARLSGRSVYYIAEAAEWSILWDGRYLTRGAKERGISIQLGSRIHWIQNQVIHFGSVHGFVAAPESVLQANKVIVTFYHGRLGVSEAMDRGIRAFLKKQHFAWRVVVSCNLMAKRLQEWGVPESKIVKLPLGVDLSLFRPIQAEEKARLKVELGIPQGRVCIGSFQKDGVGWGEGNEPKLEKGPDLFVRIAEKLSSRHSIHCLLTGPARGYVKKELLRLGIPFTHVFIPNYLDIVRYYQALDLYLVTSREEGGPKAVLEALATGTPLVTTAVGMAPEVIQHEKNGMIHEPEDVEGMAKSSARILVDENLRQSLVKEGLEAVKDYDWNAASELVAPLYREALASVD